MDHPAFQATQSSTPSVPETAASPEQPTKLSSRNWKMWIIIGGIVLVILLTGTAYILSQQNSQKPEAKKVIQPTAGQPSPSSDPTADWKTYQDQNYSIKYPSDFQLNENRIAGVDGVMTNKPESIQLISSPVSESNGNFSMEISHNPTTMTLNEYIDTSAMCSDISSSKTKAFEIGGNPALQTDYTNCGVRGAAYIYTLYKGNVYRITVATTVKNYNKDILPLVLKILSTLKFTNQTNCVSNPEKPWIRKETKPWNISYPGDWAFDEYALSPDGGLYLDGCYKGNYYVISGSYPLGSYDSLNTWVDEAIINKLPQLSQEQRSAVEITDTTIAGAPTKKILNVSKIGSTDPLDISHHLYIWRKDDKNPRIVSIQQTDGMADSQQMEELLDLFAEGIR